ncbi:MAG: MarR family transcriptional regulator [Gammaproteobacteria bacterium]|nr:MarR family transcriptional regulator [Gammaproteobacteria bacterium]
MTYRIRDTIGFNLFITNVALRAGMAREMRPFDITPEQFAILSLLQERGGLQQREIAELLLKDRPSITRILERMQNKRLIRRETDPKDRRAVRVHLTATGKKLFPKVEKIALDFRKQAYQGLSETKLNQLKQTLHHISENLA